MNWKACILVALGALMVMAGFILRLRGKRLTPPEEPASVKEKKAYKRSQRMPVILLCLGGWLALSELITLIFGASHEEFEVAIFAPVSRVLGLTVSSSVVTAWILTATITLLALLFRFVAFPRFAESPKGLQNVIELAVEQLSKYCGDKLSHPLGENLAAYMFAVAVYMVGAAAVELFGVRAPTSDIIMTFSLSLITFLLINYYGIRQKGVAGRIKSMAQPTPVILPINILSNIAVPISLACRLFGNMLGGLIVIDLLYFALGNFAVGAPAVLGLYFNVFHPLIQAFIFITLSLTFINEAIE